MRRIAVGLFAVLLILGACSSGDRSNHTGDTSKPTGQNEQQTDMLENANQQQSSKTEKKKGRPRMTFYSIPG